MPISWAQFISSPPQRPPFLVDPIIPREGIVFLHAKFSTGKSPLSWELARCVGSEPQVDFLGFPTHAGRVGYIETDTPPVLIHSRLDLVPTVPQNVWFEFLPQTLDILAPSPKVVDSLRELARLDLDLLIVNTLRKSYRLSANDAEVTSRVYGAFREFFPGAALVFIAHDRKESTMPGAKSALDEQHSGSQAWLDGAQVGLHLVQSGKNLRLDVTKSQVCEKFSIMLRLESDGTTLKRLDEASLDDTRAALEALPPGLPVREMDSRIAAVLGVSERTARSYRLKLAQV